MKIKLSEMANLAEIISAFAIVISLIYVGIQVTDNTKAIRSAAANDAANTIQAWYLAVGTDSGTSDLYLRGIQNPKSLTKSENLQFIMLVHGAMMGFQNAYFMEKEGTLDTRISNALTATMASIHDYPGWKHYWEQRKEVFSPEFQKFVDVQSQIENSGTATVYQ